MGLFSSGPIPPKQCFVCGGWSDSYTLPCTCVGGPAPEPTKQEKEAITEPPSPVNVVSLTRERFNRDRNPANHSPRAALEQAIGVFDELPSDREITHAIVLFAIKTNDGGCGTRFIQAGSADHHGQMGLIAEAQQLIREAD